MRRAARLLCGVLALASWAVTAHAQGPQRSLRLQLHEGVLEGLLSVELPSSATSLAPIGQVPGESPADDEEKALGRRMARDGLAGLQLGVGRADTDAGAPVLHAPELVEARARRTPRGGLEGKLLVRAIGPRLDEQLVIAVESGLPLPVELIAESGLVLALTSGLGREIAGGLALSPRPGAPVVVRVSRAASAPAARGTPH